MGRKSMKGVVIPTITPMTENGAVDEQGVAAFAEYLIEAGVDCLYPNGTNGESLLLTEQERQRIAEIMVETSHGRVPVFIQCGAMTTAETVAHAQHSVKIGADGIGIMSPAFFPMDEEALFQYYSDVISPLPEGFPVYIYNIPGCTTNDVKPELLNRLMNAFPNIAGIKFSSPDLMRVEDYFEKADRKPELLIGCDSLFLQCLITGGVGTVTGPGSIFHERFTRLYRQFQEGDMKGAMKTQEQIVDLDRKLAGIPGIPGLKALLKIRGVIQNDVCRKPLRALIGEEYKKLEKIVEEYEKEEQING
ncbi:MAG TPA: dihydrodipicolinate synthase family protein [Candidatus Mediterraneibacter norfolkensis]|nr:dihydrodipicolinate synthase family protein [Candidatus Mediterraneibacter norfolkensis]